MAINCIANTCAGAGSKLQSYYKDYYQVLLANICTVEHGSHGTIMVASSTLDFSDSAIRKVKDRKVDLVIILTEVDCQ